MRRLDKILVVDDDPSVLTALRHLLPRHYQGHFCTSGAEALAALRSDGPFAVVLTDMRMVGMDGIQLLRKARQICPDFVAMMLTGDHNHDTAIEAVNQGHVFRFLAKPCTRESLEQALKDAVDTYRARVLERDMLERTLTGSVQLLCDLLHMLRPRLFADGQRVRRVVRELARQVGSRDPWAIELASLLVNLPAAFLPEEVYERCAAGVASESELLALGEQKQRIAACLGHIPRLEMVGEIIRQISQVPAEDSQAGRAAQLLRVARLVDRELSCHPPRSTELFEELARSGDCPPRLLNAVLNLDPAGLGYAQRFRQKEVQAWSLRAGMILLTDVHNTRGDLVLARGHQLTEHLAERLRTFAKLKSVTGGICVLVPVPDEPAAAADAPMNAFDAGTSAFVKAAD